MQLSECDTKPVAVGVQPEADANDKPGEGLPLPTTPPGQLPTGLASDVKAMKAPRHNESWAPSFLKGKTAEAVNADLDEVPLVRHLARRLQVTPVVVAVGFLLLSLIFLLYGVGGQLVCTIFGVALPAFESFKAVEEFANLQEGDGQNVYNKASGMQFWLTYWIVVAAISSIECLFYYVVVWIPGYYPLKLGFLVYLYIPRVRGANHVYNWFVSPVLKRNRATIDLTLEESSRGLRKSVSNVASSAMDAGLGAGKESMVRLRRGLTMVGPGIETMRILSSELVKRRSAPARPEPEVSAVQEVPETEPEPEVAEAEEPEPAEVAEPEAASPASPASPVPVFQG
ncbi:unnamed protein product [Effrenium voratum]|uniref:Receptor expression-enhancing protein n=1 Tax=Effrenium voratum TaxID=2562239 RepID=A0AA36N6V7_9DINO|nr:unnamed protein product [Effrenium voratum]CAJ1419075.1 unnamed protein product [Effrenium voratum]